MSRALILVVVLIGGGCALAAKDHAKQGVVEAAVDAALVAVRETTTAGGDVNAVDYWTVRGLVALLILDRVLDWRRRRQRSSSQNVVNPKGPKWSI